MALDLVHNTRTRAHTPVLQETAATRRGPHQGINVQGKSRGSPWKTPRPQPGGSVRTRAQAHPSRYQALHNRQQAWPRGRALTSQQLAPL